MTLSMPKPLDKCPRTPECVSQVLYKDDEGNLYRLDTKSREFVPHICSTKGASEKPRVVYLAEWRNIKTGRTRWVGPARMRKSVEIAPADGAYRRRGPNGTSDWEHVATFITVTRWEAVKSDD